MMRGGSAASASATAGPASEQDSTNELLATLVESLLRSADDPPREVQGVPDSFLDELERVPKGELKETESCPICGNPFLDGECGQMGPVHE